MGLEVVELVMEVEDAFDVQIPNERAAQLTTVGSLYNYIVEAKRDAGSSRNVCLSAVTFYRIRRAICVELDLSPRAVRPRIELETTLPKLHRRKYWSKLQTALNLKLPKLARPIWLEVIATIVVFAAALWAGIVTFRENGLGWAVLAAFGGLIAACWVVLILTHPFATRFRPEFATFRGLSIVVLAHNYGRLCEQAGSSNSTEIWDALKLIIIEQLGVNPEEITPNARFVQDLGIG